MRLHQNIAALLSSPEGGAIFDLVGPTYRVLPATEDRVQDPEHGFIVYFAFQQTGGGNSPTVRVRLQTSLDKVNWTDVLESSLLEADGVRVELRETLNPATPLLPYVRAVTVLGGNPKPNHKVDARLVGSAPFRLKKES